MKVERNFYVTCRDDSRLLTHDLKDTSSWNVVDATRHLSIDAMKQLSIPTFGAHDQPSETYYHPVVSVSSMAVFDEGKQESVVYVYDQTSPTTCSDSVVSCLDRFLTDHRCGCKRLIVSMDNHPVNKSHVVLPHQTRRLSLHPCVIVDESGCFSFS